MIAQDPRLPLLEAPITAASLARLGDDDPMLLTELLCGACAPASKLRNMVQMCWRQIAARIVPVSRYC